MSDNPKRRWYQFSLGNLMVVVTLAAVLSFFGYLVTREFFVYKRIDCGEGRLVELLRPNDLNLNFSEGGRPRYFRFSGMPSEQPVDFFFTIGDFHSPIRLVSAEGGNLVGITDDEFGEELDIIIDFRTCAYWPKGSDRDVDDDARDMLARLRQSNSKLWLRHTYDGELAMPYPLRFRKGIDE